jgi:outer membrane biosynthesis protein TonB
MGLPSSPLLPIRLLPPAPRACSLQAAGLSLVLHGGALALAASICGRGPAPRPATVSLLHGRVAAVSYVAIAPMPRPDGPLVRGGKAAEPRPVPNRPPQHQIIQSSLFALIPAALDGSVSAASPEPPAATTTPEPTTGDSLSASGDQPVVDAPVEAAADASSNAAARGITNAAELRSRPGDACPVLRRPPRFEFPEDGLEVAVSFVVDTAGSVDPATLHVVDRPGAPAAAAEFVPRVYVVGVQSRQDRTLPSAGPAFGAILADDLVRRVATLRFKPASRDGRPTPSGVLIACRAVQ